MPGFVEIAYKKANIFHSSNKVFFTSKVESHEKGNGH